MIFMYLPFFILKMYMQYNSLSFIVSLNFTGRATSNAIKWDVTNLKKVNDEDMLREKSDLLRGTCIKNNACKILQKLKNELQMQEIEKRILFRNRISSF